MSIIITQSELLPIRRDKQLSSASSINTSSGGGGGGTSMVISGGINICLYIDTGATTTISVCGTVANANNTICVNGKTESNLCVKNSDCLNTHTEATLCVNYANCTNYSSCSGCAANLNGHLECQLNVHCALSAGTAGNSISSNSAIYATTAGNSNGLCGCTPVCFLGALSCASDSKCLGGILPAGYLLSGGTAKNSTCVNGKTESNLCVKNSDCLNTHTESTLCVQYSNCSNYASCAGCATNLGGKTEAQLCVCKAVSATTAGNSISSNSAIYATTAGNSNGLCGCTPVCFLGATATATCATTADNSLCLGGALANTYAPLTSPIFKTTLCLCAAVPILTIDTTCYPTYPMTLGVNTDATTHLIFGNNGCNDIRVGRVAAGGMLDIYVNNTCPQTTASDGIHTMQFASNGSVCVYCTLCAGNICSLGTVCASGCIWALDYVATSDRRLKTDITPIQSALSTVQKLCGVNFKLCNDIESKNHIGLIAQDVELIVPEVVTHTHFSYGVKYQNLTALLIEAVKEQQKEIDCLRKDMNYYNNGNYKNNSDYKNS